jgi:hypothetical protein
MKKFYPFLLSILCFTSVFGQVENCVTITGDRTSGKYRQLWLDSNNPFGADSTQPETGAAAWTCNALGFPICNMRGLFRYDVSGIPANAVVTSAKLYLYAKTNNINGNPGLPTFGSNNAVSLQRVTAPWSLGGTGWNNQPPTTSFGQKVLPQSTNTAQNYIVDMTEMVQSWVNHPDSNYGAMMRVQTEAYYNSMIFHSGQGPEQLRPKLEICYTIPPPPSGCNNSVIIKGDRISGKYRQLWLDSNNPFGADSTQPETGAAAWTCNALGFPICNVRGLFRYDVSGIPANAVVTSAKLYLYAKTNNINGNPGLPTFGSNNAVLLQRVMAPWSLGGTGWNNQPPTTAAGQQVLPQSTGTAQNYTVDMKALVQHWVNHPDSNYGAMMRVQIEQYYNSMIFHSGQAPDSLKPRLEICYEYSRPDTCKVDFRDSLQSNNSLHRQFTALPWHNNLKKPVQICWIFGDGKDTCINYNPAINYGSYVVSHTYAIAGTYNVCVKIKYEGGCSKDLCKPIKVIAPPPPPSCSNLVVIRGNRTSGKFRQLWLDSNAPFSADSTQPEMGAAAWTCNALGYPVCNMRGLFKYDLSQIPANAVVTSAKFYLYAKTNNINGVPGQPTYGSNNAVLLQRVMAPWNLAGTGWSNQPPTTTFGQKVLPQSTHTAQNYVVDMTDLAQVWVNHPDSNYGAMLRMQTEAYYNSMIFHSGQGPDSLRPALEICYTVPQGSDSCKADFVHIINGNNPLQKLFKASGWNSAGKKPIQICWSFGDGTDTCINYFNNDSLSNNNYQVVHTYANHGNYEVCVKIKYEGCTAEKCKKVTVFGAPPPPQCNTTVIISGDRASGKFQQLWLNNNGPFSSDTTQPEMGAAAWTCNALGYPICNMRTVFRFDFGGIPANAVVTSARLHLYAKTNNINGYPGNPTYGSNNAVLLQRVIAPWNLAGTGWSNQPPTTSFGQKVLPQSTNTAQNYVVDMTDLVQSWINHPDSNYGAQMRMQAEQYYNSMIFHSGQSPDSLKPKLEICFTVPQADSNDVQIKLYPNPTTGPLVAWILTRKQQTGDIKLYDPYGRLRQVLKTSVVYTPGLNVIPLEIDRTSLRPGVYYVKIRVGGIERSFRIMLI